MLNMKIYFWQKLINILAKTYSIFVVRQKMSKNNIWKVGWKIYAKIVAENMIEINCILNFLLFR